MNNSEKLSPFQIMDNIYRKTGHLTEEELKGNYIPYIINKGFGNSLELVFFAQEMNLSFNLPIEMQYDFYYHIIEKRSRYIPWNKKDKTLDEKIDLIKKVYNYSSYRARETVPIIDMLDLWGHLEKRTNQGGFNKQGGFKKTKKIKK